MPEIIFAAIGLLIAGAGLFYAHHQYTSSVQSPILRLSFCHPDTRKIIDNPEDPRLPIQIEANASDFIEKKKHLLDGQDAGVKIPLLLRNFGTRTARKIRIHARYSAVFSVSTHGKIIEDGEHPKLTIVEHEIPDLHPKQTYMLNGDFLVPDDVLLHGKFKTKVKIAKNHLVAVSATINLAAIIEIVVFADDLEPTIRKANFIINKQK